MGEDLEVMKYYTAAEKVQNLTFVIEMTLEFMNEFGIEPDDEVKKALNPFVSKLNAWLK